MPNPLPIRQGHELQQKQQHKLDKNNQTNPLRQQIQTNPTRHNKSIMGHQLLHPHLLHQ